MAAMAIKCTAADAHDGATEHGNGQGPSPAERSENAARVSLRVTLVSRSLLALLLAGAAALGVATAAPTPAPSVATVAPNAAPNPGGSAGADVLIQAGHEGRPDCNVEPASLCHNTGAAAAPGEITWTPVVADEATRILRAAGVSVLRERAYLHGSYAVRAAVFIHFDGSVPPCSSRASVGYPPGAASKKLADAWKALYREYWPYGFEADNFTSNLTGYYAYHHVRAPGGMFVLEGGDMSCPPQNAWLARNLKWQGALLAHVLSAAIGKGNVPLPSAPAK
jgi:hypothetical protein